MSIPRFILESGTALIEHPRETAALAQSAAQIILHEESFLLRQTKALGNVADETPAIKQSIGEANTPPPGQIPYFSAERNRWQTTTTFGTAEFDASSHIPNLYARIRPSVVQIAADNFAGTGFVIDKQLIATADHVIANHTTGAMARKVGVRLDDGSTLSARILARAPREDVALLHVPGLGSRLPSIPLIGGGSLKTKDNVFTIGHAGGKTVAYLSQGVHDARTIFRPKTYDSKLPNHEVAWLDNAMPAYPGNSGGPLLTAKGESAGVVTVSDSVYTRGPTAEHIMMMREATSLIPQKGWLKYASNADFDEAGNIVLRNIDKWKIDETPSLTTRLLRMFRSESV
ncbi:MAG TPA: serine protease [Candidatus Melainabacteria bacterium]|nr:serine protease [Candidatus Melainabacteria bacterium]HIN64246.1 serine protease [Candidatus Obscuribacterales bacterium]